MKVAKIIVAYFLMLGFAFGGAIGFYDIGNALSKSPIWVFPATFFSICIFFWVKYLITKLRWFTNDD